MGDTAGVGMLGLDAKADDKGAVAVLAIEERPVVVEERAGAEQRFESGRRIAFHGQAPRSAAVTWRCSALTSTLTPNQASKPWSCSQVRAYRIMRG